MHLLDVFADLKLATLARLIIFMSFSMAVL